MSRVVEIPASFDDRSFEQFAASVLAGPTDPFADGDCELRSLARR